MSRHVEPVLVTGASGFVGANLARRPVTIPKRIVLASHILVTGPAQELHRYLLDKCETLVYVHHPLQPFTPMGDHRSVCERYLRGQLVTQRSWAQWALSQMAVSELLLFAWHTWLTFWWGVWQGWGSDVFIGINPLNAFVGVILRRLGVVHSVVYKTIDYVPDRFTNHRVNAFYHWVDRAAVAGCDQVWNLSSRMVAAREARGVPPRYRAKQVTVPIGTDLRVVPKSANQVERHTVVYFGGLIEKQGVQLGIEALPVVRQQVPAARLRIIGGGQPAWAEVLRRLAESLGVSDAVEFTGIIDDHEEALARLAECAVGIAPYTDDSENYTQYTDPGKPKAYLAAGLPVVLTNVPEVARIIEQAGAGFIVPYRSEALAEALVRLLTDDELFDACKRRARTLAEQYDWNLVFDRAFAALGATRR